MKELIESAKEWTAGYGDPFEDGALGGPLVSKRQRDKVAGFVDSARQEGAQIVYGGDKWEGKGWYYLPTSKYHPCKVEQLSHAFCPPPDQWFTDHTAQLQCSHRCRDAADEGGKGGGMEY